MREPANVSETSGRATAAKGHAPESPALARLGVLGAAALFSTGGAAIKACSLTGLQVACFRSIVAALVLLVLFPARRALWNARALLVGAAYAATLILFVVSTKLTTAANAIFLQSTSPLYLLLLGPWLLREPIRRRDLAFVGPIAAGLVLLMSATAGPVATAPDPARGNTLAVLSGLAWALTLMGLRWLGRGSPAGTNAALPAVILGNLEAFLFCLPWAVPARVTASDFVAIGYLGLFQIGLAYILLTRSMRHVPVLEASLLLFLEPVLNPVWAWLVHGERPGVLALVGGVIILGATMLRALTASVTAETPAPD